jgi:hypothetical protein
VLSSPAKKPFRRETFPLFISEKQVLQDLFDKMHGPGLEWEKQMHHSREH